MTYTEHWNTQQRQIVHPRVFRGAATADYVPAQGLAAKRNSLSNYLT